MRFAVKYGLLITAGIAGWVVIAHLLVPDPCSPVHFLGPLVLFNLLEIAGIYFGMSALKRDQGGQLQFKAGLKTGLGISLVYGISSCVFFLIFLMVVGPQIMCSRPAVVTPPFWQAAAFAFAGQFLFALILGLLYATVIAFVLATRRTGD